MGKRKRKNKNKKRRENIISWITLISLSIFVFAGILLIYDWISANKWAIFIISGAVVLLFILIGLITPKRTLNTFKRAIFGRFLIR